MHKSSGRTQGKRRAVLRALVGVDARPVRALRPARRCVCIPNEPRLSLSSATSYRTRCAHETPRALFRTAPRPSHRGNPALVTHPRALCYSRARGEARAGKWLCTSTTPRRKGHAAANTPVCFSFSYVTDPWTFFEAPAP